MATETVTSPERAPERLACLQTICMDIAQRIDTARQALRDSEERPYMLDLVADCLERIGWMAERAGCLAGEQPMTSEASDAEFWLLDKRSAEMLRGLRKDAAQTSASA